MDMKSRHQEIIRETVDILIKELKPEKIILFGSRAKGTSSDTADFDLAINGSAPDMASQRRIHENIEKVSGLYGVDVIYLENVDKEFKDLVQKTGKVIYERGTPTRF